MKARTPDEIGGSEAQDRPARHRRCDRCGRLYPDYYVTAGQCTECRLYHNIRYRIGWYGRHLPLGDQALAQASIRQDRGRGWWRHPQSWQWVGATEWHRRHQARNMVMGV